MEHGGVDPIPVPLELLFGGGLKGQRVDAKLIDDNVWFAKFAIFRFEIQTCHRVPNSSIRNTKFAPKTRGSKGVKEFWIGVSGRVMGGIEF